MKNNIQWKFLPNITNPRITMENRNCSENNREKSYKQIELSKSNGQREAVHGGHLESRHD